MGRDDDEFVREVCMRVVDVIVDDDACEMSIIPSSVITSSATWIRTTRPMTIAPRLPSFGVGMSMVCMYVHSMAIGEAFFVRIEMHDHSPPGACLFATFAEWHAVKRQPFRTGRVEFGPHAFLYRTPLSLVSRVGQYRPHQPVSTTSNRTGPSPSRAGMRYRIGEDPTLTAYGTTVDFIALSAVVG